MKENDDMIINDKRTGCQSAIITTDIKTYIKLVHNVYLERGGIEGQRAPLKTKTGIRIRKRMVDDIHGGTILPPLVLGATLNDEEFSRVATLKSSNELMQFMSALETNSISIIDGMQRTTAILEANKEGYIDGNPLRIELWLAKSISSLIYRMLILNTGQVPWDMKRQLETIYQPILKEIKKEIPNVEILLLDSSQRRTQSTQYQSSKLIEFFLAFSSRKINVDIKEKIAEDFARMEASEATSKDNFLPKFIQSLDLLSKLDHAFDKYKKTDEDDGRIKNGKDIFNSSPAGIGFMAAASVSIYGPPGFNLSEQEVSDNTNKLKASIEGVVKKIESLNDQEVGDFLDLAGLNEKLGTRSGKVGDFEREFFLKAFIVLIQYGNELPSMEPCWVAR